MTLPDSTEGFKLCVNVEAVSAINEISIYTDANAFGLEQVKCRIDEQDNLSSIVCKNIGQLTCNTTKFIKFAFTIESNYYHNTFNEENIYYFGTMKIKRMDGEIITTTT